MGFTKGVKFTTKQMSKDVLAKLKQDLTGAERLLKKNVENVIIDTQARDTDTLLNSIATERTVGNGFVRLEAKVLNRPYTSSNPTPASYTATEAPDFSPPAIPTEKSTIKTAILIMWGLGVHAKKGPRNFLGEGIEKTAEDLGLKGSQRVK